jgi:hypothetical protein
MLNLCEDQKYCSARWMLLELFPQKIKGFFFHYVFIFLEKTYLKLFLNKMSKYFGQFLLNEKKPKNHIIYILFLLFLVFNYIFEHIYEKKKKFEFERSGGTILKYKKTNCFSKTFFASNVM